METHKRLAADRIKELEGALREICELNSTVGPAPDYKIKSRYQCAEIARAALKATEMKDD